MNNANSRPFTGNPQEEHFTFHFVMREDPVSDELKAATIAGMKQRLKARELREQRRKKTARTAMAAAAILLIVLFATPLGGYVASAAESLFYSLSEWAGKVFDVTGSQLDRGEERYHIDIVSAEVENEFIIVNFDAANKDLWLSAAGRIYDESGNSVQLYSDVSTVRDTQPSYDHTGWKMYAPGLTQLIVSANANYRCSLTVTVWFESAEWTEEYSEEKHFDFALANVDNVLNCKRYAINETVETDAALFRITDLFVTQFEQNMVIEVTPVNAKTFAENPNFEIDISMPEFETTDDDGNPIEYRGFFEDQIVISSNDAKYYIIKSFQSNYVRGYDSGKNDNYFTQYCHSPFQFTIGRLAYRINHAKKVVESSTEPVEYIELPDVNLPVKYNKRGEIKADYKDISIQLPEGITVRFDGIEKARESNHFSWNCNDDDSHTDCHIHMTVDVGNNSAVPHNYVPGRYIDVVSQEIATSRRGSFEVALAAMKDDREVFRIRGRMSLMDEVDRTPGSRVFPGVISLSRPYVDYYTNNIINISADNMESFRRQDGDYISLDKMCNMCQIDSFKLISIGFEIRDYTVPEQHPEEAVQNSRQFTMLNSKYFNTSLLPHEFTYQYSEYNSDEFDSNINRSFTVE